MSDVVLFAFIMVASCSSGEHGPDPSSSTGIERPTRTGVDDIGTSFIVAGTESAGMETEGGEHEGRWYSPCFSKHSGPRTCSSWCSEYEYGECLYVETYDGACGPFGDGYNLLGWCGRDFFGEAVGDVAQSSRIRCVCT